MLASVLQAASSMPALHRVFAGVQLSFQSQRWERNALNCPCFVAKRLQPRATPRASSSWPLLSAKRVPRGIRHKNTETGAQCAAPRCALAI